MFNRTNLARAALVCITAIWFGVPFFSVLFERGLGLRILVSSLAFRPVVAFLIPVVLIGLATWLYPKRAEDSTKLTVLPLVSLTLCLYGLAWLESELQPGELGHLLTAVEYGSLGFVLLLFSLHLWPSQHRALLLSVPALVAVSLMFGEAFPALDETQNPQRGDQLVTALASFHGREGCYPDSLEDLVPQDLAEVPRPVTWFWLGSRFHYEPSEHLAPGKRPTAYKITYVMHGYEGFASSSRSQNTGWSYSSPFEGDPQFDHPRPKHWMKRER